MSASVDSRLPGVAPAGPPELNGVAPKEWPRENDERKTTTSIIYQLLRLGVKYGTRFVNWVNANRSRIMGWVRDGLALDAIIAPIKQILGIN